MNVSAFPTAEPGPPPCVSGRYRADRHHRFGNAGGGAPSSNIWAGTDLETGAAIVIKAYTRHDDGRLREPELFLNEVEVQRDLAECRHLARMLHVDEKRCVIVKEFVEGPDYREGAGVSALRGVALRRAVLGALDLALRGHLAGRAIGHALECDNYTLRDGAFVAFESCNSFRRPWTSWRSTTRMPRSSTSDADELLCATLWMTGWNPSSADARDMRAGLLDVHGIRMRALTDADPQLADAFESHIEDVPALHRAVERLA